MVLNLIFYNGSPKIVIFHELLIVETCNKCHWIWHASNPTYAPFKQFWCIFPVKINKMWNFCLKLWFFRNCLCQKLETCGIGFCMIGTLSMCHSSHFNAFYPVKINKMWNFGCFLNSPWQKLKKYQFAQRKSVCKGLQIYAYRFLGMHVCNALC